MKTQLRVLVIGGGIAGCSVLYHLTKLGWKDVGLVEKGELTSGTTWHSVGNTPVFTTSLNLMRVLKSSNELYQSLEEETGQAVGYHAVGSLRLATTPDLLAWYKHIADLAQVIGVDFENVSVERALELNPLISSEGLLGASFIASDGYVDPSSVTQALAKGARQRGAEILTNTRVLAINPRRDGGWEVVTEKGTIAAGIAVNAAGQWGAEIGRMAGVELPLIPMEHQYIVTEALPKLKSLAREIPVTRDPERTFYLRQEGDGLLIGFFELDARAWGVEGIPREFNQQLLQPDFSRMEDYLVSAAERVPILEHTGIRRIVNGPDAYTPDGRCIMGFVPGVQNFFVLAGFSCFGIANSGGAGKYAAEWIVDGQPSVDMWELDVRRYGPYVATKSFLLEKAIETYAKEYAVHYPYEERPAGRPLKTSPLYDQLKSRGAVYAARHGWERPMWFAPPGVEPIDETTFQRPNWFKYVGDECRAVRSRVGVLDQTSFGKLEVSGPGACAFLDHLCSNALPVIDGKMVVTQMLNERGGIECDLTVTRIAPDKYWIITAAWTTTHDFAWIGWQAQSKSGVSLREVTNEFACLSLMGPRSRDVLRRISDEGVSNEAFPFLTCRDIHIGSAPVRAFRVSYVGELGWELYHPIEYQRYVYDRIIEAGAEYSIVNFGYRALDSMRMEKGYRFWGVDMSALDTPLEAGLGRFVKLEKNFIGRDPLLRQKQEGPKKSLTCLVLEGNGAVPHGWEPVIAQARNGDSIVGYVTSGEYGHVVEKTIAFSYLPPDIAKPGTQLAVKIMGERLAATVVTAPLYDPANSRMKL